MNKKDEALKMAIETIRNFKLIDYDMAEKAINACKEALEQPALKDEKGRPMTYWGGLEQPAQEPVAWMKSAIDNARDVCKYLDHDMVKEAKAHTKFFWGDIDKIKEAEDALSNSDTI